MQHIMLKAYRAKQHWENGNYKAFGLWFKTLNSEILSTKGPPRAYNCPKGGGVFKKNFFMKLICLISQSGQEDI